MADMRLQEIAVFVWITCARVYSEIFKCPEQCFCPPAENRVNCDRTKYKSIPQNLPKSTKSLSLSHNPISRLRPEDFAQYNDLEEIFLHNNTIQEIAPYTFSNLRNLKQVSIRNSPLKRLRKLSFGKMRSNHRIKLYLTNNQIQTIERHAFDESQNFQTLDLRWNPVKEIQSRAFSNLYNVVYLELPTGIRHLDPEAFSNLTRVHILQITGLKAGSSGIKKHTFRGLHHVSGIFIQDSDLGTISSQAFSGIKTVEEIKISSSEINRIRKRGFENMAHVGELALVSNRINRLDKNFLNHVPKDTKVKMEKNQLNCSCENIWLLDSERASDTILRNNYCLHPKFLENLSLIEIKDLHQGYLDNCSDYVYEDSGGTPNLFSTTLLTAAFLASTLTFHAFH